MNNSAGSAPYLWPNWSMISTASRHFPWSARRVAFSASAFHGTFSGQGRNRSWSRNRSGNPRVVIQRGQNFARTRVVLRRKRGVQPKMSLCAEHVSGFQQGAAHGAERLEHAERHLALHERQRPLQRIDRLAGLVVLGQQNRFARVGRGAVAVCGDKLRDRFACRVHLAERHLERRLQVQQRRPAGMRRERLLDVPQRRPRLLAFDHAVDFFDFTDQIGAAELQLLAAAARAYRVRIDWHGSIRNAARIVRS